MKIQDIKNKILTLAIQGKLVEQNPSDEPAAVLLERIKAEKELLIKEKKIKKEKPLLEIMEEEKAFEIPEGWEWCRLGEITNIVRGSSPRPKGHPKYFMDDKTDYNWVTIKDITQYSNGKYLSKTNEYLTYDGSLKSRFVKSGEIIIAVSGSIGKTVIMECDGYIYDGLAALKNIIDEKIFTEYIYLVLLTWKKSLNDISEGTSIQNINTDKLNSITIGLPSLSEQQRIVAKVEELFKIVDALEENKGAMLKNIADTRNKVLQLAIEGKLVAQEEGDEPASVLLEKIAKEKEQLIKEKKIKKEKPLPEILEEEKRFEIPKGWEWCRLNDVSSPAKYSFVDGPFGSNLKREHYVDEGIRIIQLQNVGEGIWKDTNKIYTSIEKADELIRCNAYPGELVIAKMNPIARATIIPDKEDRYVLCSDCVKLRPAKSISVNYLEYLMNSNYMKNKASEDGTGTTRQRTSLGKLKSMPIPLPPLPEQHRIVAKVDELMEYLNNLEKTILGD